MRKLSRLKTQKKILLDIMYIIIATPVCFAFYTDIIATFFINGYVYSWPVNHIQASTKAVGLLGGNNKDN